MVMFPEVLVGRTVLILLLFTRFVMIFLKVIERKWRTFFWNSIIMSNEKERKFSMKSFIFLVVDFLGGGGGFQGQIQLQNSPWEDPFLHGGGSGSFETTNPVSSHAPWEVATSPTVVIHVSADTTSFNWVFQIWQCCELSTADKE